MEKNIDLLGFLKLFCHKKRGNECLTEFCSLLKKMGLDIENNNGYITIKEYDKEHIINIDCTNDDRCKDILHSRHRKNRKKEIKKGTTPRRARRTENDKIRKIIFYGIIQNNFSAIKIIEETLKNDNKNNPINSGQRAFIDEFKINGFMNENDINNFKTLINSYSSDYIKAAWIFAFLCFPMEKDEVNVYNRSRLLKEALKDKCSVQDAESQSTSHNTVKKTTAIDITVENDNNCCRINEKDIGRERELNNIKNMLHSNYHIALYGLGGIGKTYICRKIFWDYRETTNNDGIKYVAWIKYNKNLDQSFRNTFKSRKILPSDEYNKGDCIFAEYDDEPVLKRMYKELNDPSNNIITEIVRTAFNKLGKSLLVILDNANEINDDDINWLKSCYCHIIMTTRRHQLDYFKLVHIEGTDTEYCCELYRKNCDKKERDKFNDEENYCIRQIVKLADRHTLSIELIAKAQHCSHSNAKTMLEQLKATGFSLPEISETIQVDGENRSFIEHLSKIFDISDIKENELQLRIMRNFSLLEPNTPINPTATKAWFELNNFNDINKLIKSGWLNDEDDGCFSIHPVISDVIRYSYPIDYSYSEPFIKAMIDHSNKETDIQAFFDNAKQYKSVVDRFNGVKEESYGTLLILTARSLSSFGSTDSAIDCYDRFMELCKGEMFENDSEKGALEMIKGYRYELLQKYNEAIDCFISALELMRSSFNEHPPFKPYLYYQIGSNYAHMQDFSHALENYNTALRFYKELYGEDNVDVGYCYGNIALLFAVLDECDKAWESLYKAENSMKNDKTGIGLTFINYIKGSIYFIQEDSKNAQQYLDKAFAPDSLLSIIPAVSAKCAPLSARIYADNSDNDKALFVLNNSIETLSKNAKKNSLQLVDCYITKAGILYGKGDYESFLENYNQAVNIWNENISEIDPSDQFAKNTAIKIIRSATNEAKYAISQQDLYSALSWHNSIVYIIEPYVAEDDPELASQLYACIANLLWKTNDLQNSLIYYKKALEFSEISLGTDNAKTLEIKKNIEEIENKLMSV